MSWRKVIGITLIVLGTILAAWIMGAQIQSCLDGWNNEFKSKTFECFFAYFFSVSKGAIIISLAAMLLPASLGILLISKRNEP